jgi:molecular chaperone HscC
VDGLLEVEATTDSTGEVRRLVVEKTVGALTPEEIQQRFEALAKLKVHPRDQAKNRALLARAGRLDEENVGDVRHGLDREAQRFEHALSTQDEQQIRHARGALLAVLATLEADFDA